MSPHTRGHIPEGQGDKLFVPHTRGGQTYFQKLNGMSTCLRHEIPGPETKSLSPPRKKTKSLSHIPEGDKLFVPPRLSRQTFCLWTHKPHLAVRAATGFSCSNSARLAPGPGILPAAQLAGAHKDSRFGNAATFLTRVRRPRTPGASTVNSSSQKAPRPKLPAT